MPNDCNTKEGIENRIKSEGYPGLYNLFKERRERQIHPKVVGSRTVHTKDLQHFVILGRFALDHMGNVFRLNRELFTDEDRARMPVVMTQEEYAEYCTLRHPKDHAKHLNPGRWEKRQDTQALLLIAPPDIACAKCGKADWSLENCHDIESQWFPEHIIVAPDQSGKTLKDIETEFVGRSDGVWVLKSGKTPHDSYIVTEGEIVLFRCDRYYHAACYAEQLLKDEAEEKQKYHFLLSLAKASPDD